MNVSFTAECDEIVATHHALLRSEIPRLNARWAELQPPAALLQPWHQLIGVLLPHMDKEEQILFPQIRQLDEGVLSGGCGIGGPIKQMNYEHGLISALEACVREAAQLAGPEERALLALMDDLAVHAQREENELFPAALAASFRTAGAMVDVEEYVDKSPAQPFALEPGVRLIRNTGGRCSTCLTAVPARVVRDAHEARLEKLCPVHGITRQLLSRSPDTWERLDRYYFSVNSESYPQRDYILRMTEKCNLDCPICLARANTADTPDLDLGKLKELLSERRGIKVDLMAAEPTLREDLEEWIRTVKSAGSIAALHTNGLKLANREYAKRIKAAGVDEVFLQFDGLDDEANKVLRGRPLNKTRLAALKNLRELNIATSLIVVVARGVNEAEVARTLHFALAPENGHIREVFYLGLRMLGSNRAAARDGAPLGDSTLMPDELIDLLTTQVPSITRPDVENFNKLYFAMLSTFRVKKCLYVQHYLMVRGGENVATPIGALLDLTALAGAADRYAALRPTHPTWAKAELLGALARHGTNRHTLPMLGDLMRLEMLFSSGMNLGQVPGRFLLIGFITACDPHNFDSQVAVNCGKGEVSRDGGLIESGAVANVLREARFDRDLGTSVPKAVPSPHS